MRRSLASVFALLALLLCGCTSNAAAAAESIQRQYAAVETAQMEAQVVCHMAAESRTYTLRCDYDGQRAATTVTAPEELQGITAAVSPDGLEVTYDGVSLPAGDARTICPANCLPWLLHAVGSGYLLEQNREDLRGVACHRFTLDTTDGDGEQVLCTVWLDADTLVPRYAEFTQDDRVVLTVEMLAFSCTVGEIMED